MSGDVDLTLSLFTQCSREQHTSLSFGRAVVVVKVIYSGELETMVQQAREVSEESFTAHFVPPLGLLLLLSALCVCSTHR